jgi:hypothetical protein
MTPTGCPGRFIPREESQNTIYDKSKIYNRNRFIQPKTMLNRDLITFGG